MSFWQFIDKHFSDIGAGVVILAMIAFYATVICGEDLIRAWRGKK